MSPVRKPGWTFLLFISAVAPVDLETARAWADPKEELQLPDTPAGRCAAAYFKAFNGDDDTAMAAFEKQYRAKARLAERSIDDRLKQFRSNRQRSGRVVPRHILDESPNELAIIVENEGNREWEEVRFQFEEKEPHGLDGIMIRGPVDPAKLFGSQAPLTDALRKETVSNIVKTLNENYVFPDVAEKMGQLIDDRLKQGAYDSIMDDQTFAQRLTDDLRSICHDKHLRIRTGGSREGEMIKRAQRGAGDDGQSFGFVKAEIFPGNIGYIKLNGFDPTPPAMEVAAGALGFTSFCSALIFDLRENGGGSPEMIRFISSYLFDKPTHLNSFYDRTANKTSETWTTKTVPGRRFEKDLPVYVLTSRHTFSAAEEFTYNLKCLKRATIVGETTGGGAHPINFMTLNKRFSMSVPYARAINPITRTNWEGVGVKPDIDVSADTALDAALEDARKKLAQTATGDDDE